MENVNIDEINDIMTPFLDNVVRIAKIHTEYKEKLGENHEYTKFSCNLVKIFNQYQRIFPYIMDEESFAKELVMVSSLAIDVFSYSPYELMKGCFFKKRRILKKQKEIREAKIKELYLKIDEINNKIDSDLGGVLKDESNT